MINLEQITEEQIQERLADGHPHLDDVEYPEHPYLMGLFGEPPKAAAVLMPLLKKGDAWHILLTRRNGDLPEHSGQVAFPGGRSDAEDETPEATALREAYEEIGLQPADVRLLGRLNPHLTVTNYLVTPVVGVVPWPYPFQLAEAEVSRVFTIPLDWLVDPSHYEERQRKLPAPFSSIPVIHFLPYDGEVLWGISARLTLRLLAILTSYGNI